MRNNFQPSSSADRHSGVSAAGFVYRSEPKSQINPGDTLQNLHLPVKATGHINILALPLVDHSGARSVLGAPERLGCCTTGPEIQASTEPTHQALQPPVFSRPRTWKRPLSLWVSRAFQQASPSLLLTSPLSFHPHAVLFTCAGVVFRFCTKQSFKLMV